MKRSRSYNHCPQSYKNPLLHHSSKILTQMRFKCKTKTVTYSSLRSEGRSCSIKKTPREKDVNRFSPSSCKYDKGRSHSDQQGAQNVPACEWPLVTTSPLHGCNKVLLQSGPGRKGGVMRCKSPSQGKRPGLLVLHLFVVAADVTSLDVHF